MPANPTMLGQVPLFAHLSSKALNAISRAMSERTFPAGAEIVTEGQGGIGFFIITEGTAEVVQPGESAPRGRWVLGRALVKSRCLMKARARRPCGRQHLLPVRSSPAGSSSLSCAAMPIWGSNC